MNTKKRSRWLRVLTLTLAMTLLFGLLLEAPALAAGISSKQPTIKTTESGYVNGALVLKWSGVSGASSYEIFRSSTRNGSYKKFATSRKTGLTKKTTGEFYYKVRGVKVSQKSRFSDPVHVFAANGVITDLGFSGVKGIQLRVLVSNKSNRKMSFIATNLGTIYLIDRSTGEVVGNFYASLDLPAGSYVIMVGAKQQQAVWVNSYAANLWMTYQSNPSRYAWLLALPFNPGDGSAVVDTFALAVGERASDSAVAAKK